MNYWMLSITEENFNVTRTQGYKIQGFGHRQRRKTDRMVKGDRLLYYVKGLRVFPVAATIISTVFEDEKPLWISSQLNEQYKYRVRMRAEFILRPDQYLQANQIGPRMDYIRRWPPELWHHAFWEELHLLPRKDFELIEDEMRKVLRSQRFPKSAPVPSVVQEIDFNETLEQGSDSGTL
ncbi:MAG: EVE domain-containing protein [Chloroflexota bacterium]|nr:EVE domain-containing protein [Chloroflexota bacterium]MEE2655973.1 EVE domain-containing protein [Chloroflexota bacterium]